MEMTQIIKLLEKLNIDSDVEKINEVLKELDNRKFKEKCCDDENCDYKNNDLREKCIDLHQWLNGKYSNLISDFYIDMEEKYKQGVDFNRLNSDGFSNNFKIIKGRISSLDASLILKELNTQNNNINITNINNNNISNEIKNSIEMINNNTSLSDEQIKEIKGKINEIAEIINSSINKREKWQKLSKILCWLGDKTMDAAVALLPLIFEGVK